MIVLLSTCHYTSDEGVKTMCKAMEITYKEGLWDGYARSVRSLMKKHGLTLEEAMDEVEIPAKDRQDFTENMERHKEVA